MNTPASRATYKDLIDLPDNVVGEILAGEIVTHPRPSPKHSLAALSLGGLIIDRFDRNATDGPGGW